MHYRSITDFELINKLRRQKVSYVGTVRKNKRALPAAFVNTKGREQYSSSFGFNDGRIPTSYVPRKNKCVILVSSSHENKAIDEGIGEQAKPELITFYNAHKNGLDIAADLMCTTYSVQRNTQRWPMVIFYTMLNLGGGDQFHGYQLDPMARRSFLRGLAQELPIGQLQQRRGWRDGRVVKRVRKNALPRTTGQMTENQNIASSKPGGRGNLIILGINVYIT